MQNEGGGGSELTVFSYFYQVLLDFPVTGKESLGHKEKAKWTGSLAKAKDTFKLRWGSSLSDLKLCFLEWRPHCYASEALRRLSSLDMSSCPKAAAHGHMAPIFPVSNLHASKTHCCPALGHVQSTRWPNTTACSCVKYFLKSTLPFLCQCLGPGPGHSFLCLHISLFIHSFTYPFIHLIQKTLLCAWRRLHHVSPSGMKHLARKTLSI